MGKRMGKIKGLRICGYYDIIKMDKEEISYDFYRMEKLVSYTALENHIIIESKDGGSRVVRYRQTRE